MMRWLAEAEPQLETLDTWNAESNDHMIGVNERLGYRVMGRELQFQRRALGWSEWQPTTSPACGASTPTAG